MNNGRYLTLVDLMLVEYFVRCGFAQAVLKAGWRPMSGGAFISYRKGLKPLQTYRLRFRLAAADATWNFMRFEFLRADGSLCAAGYMKGAVVGKTGFVGNAAFYARIARPFAPAEGPAAPAVSAAPAAPAVSAAPAVPATPDLPAAVQHWLAAESGVMAETSS